MMRDGVYIIRAIGTDRFKVGVTNDLERRLAEIQAMCPVHLEVVDFMTSASFEDEATLHSLLWSHHSHGEWFVESTGLHEAVRWFAIVRAAHRQCAEIIAEFVPGEAWDGLKANLYAAGAKAVADALTNLIGNSVMDRRYGA